MGAIPGSREPSPEEGLGPSGFDPERIDSAGIIHLAVRTERIAADTFWANHRRELLTIAAQLREIAREERANRG